MGALGQAPRVRRRLGRLTKLDDLYDRFPGLRPENHAITSGETDAYNCVSWVRRDLDQWWEAGFQWPADLHVPESGDLEAYVELFRRWGYERCDAPALEAGFLKLALYTADGNFVHVAKQLRDGSWSSKAGVLHDLKHRDLGALEGSWAMEYAQPTVFMRQADDRTDPMTLEHGQLLTP
jgi:hypothetical protein